MQSPSSSPNILILSVGSKVAIVKIAKLAAQKLGSILHISDSKINIPTRSFADKFTIFSNPSSLEWIQTIVAYCGENKIGLVIPTRHSEFECLNTHRSHFQKANIQLILSSDSTLDICLNKTNTANFFSQHNIPTPQTFPFDEWEKNQFFPAIAKPLSGSGSDSIFELTDSASIPHTNNNNLIVQRKAPGIEFTINAYVNHQGECVCTIPHRRIFVENGEVMQARTERISLLIDYTIKVIESLKGIVGPINLQAFYNSDSNTCQFIEINPRIGGGFPLTHQAGGHFFHWLCQEYLLGYDISKKENWTENLTMMRYREAVFH